MDIDKLNIDFQMKGARFKVKDNLNSQNVLGEFYQIVSMALLPSSIKL